MWKKISYYIWKIWNFDFADVEIRGDMLIVDSLINFEDLKKKYSKLLKNLNKELENILKDIFIRKKIREVNIGHLNKEDLIEFFNKIAINEGIEIREPATYKL